jgi:hypothetical protein
MKKNILLRFDVYGAGMYKRSPVIKILYSACPLLVGSYDRNNLKFLGLVQLLMPLKERQP